MDGRAFLDSARLLMTVPTEANRRSAVGRAYYAMHNEARSALERWGFQVPAVTGIEAFVFTRFTTAMSMDLLRVADCLQRLDQKRDKADNFLTDPDTFADDGETLRFVQLAGIGIDLLDQIEADPVRRAVAIAEIRANFP